MTGSRISTVLRSGLPREFLSLNTSAFTNENPRRSARSIASMRAATRFIAGKAKSPLDFAGPPEKTTAAQSGSARTGNAKVNWRRNGIRRIFGGWV